MGLIIFSCSPKNESKSNTAAVVKAFADGFTSESGSKAEVLYLHRRGSWADFKKVFESNTEFIFAMPLFVECIPGLVMEFFECLEPKKGDEQRANVGFILQGGFEEACQLRTAELYLEKLPGYLNCDYSGTLLKGGMFALALSSEKAKKKLLRPFYEMGKIYAKERIFEKAAVTAFAAPERYTKTTMALIWLLKPLNKIAWRYLSHKFGVKGRIDAQPYKT